MDRGALFRVPSGNLYLNLSLIHIYLKSLGIRVVEGSNANTVAVAEWVLTAALMGIRRLTDFDAKMKEGSLWCEPRRCVGMLYGKRVGLVGLGRIGRYSARLFQICLLYTSGPSEMSWGLTGEGGAGV